MSNYDPSSPVNVHNALAIVCLFLGTILLAGGAKHAFGDAAWLAVLGGGTLVFAWFFAKLGGTL